MEGRSFRSADLPVFHGFLQEGWPKPVAGKGGDFPISASHRSGKGRMRGYSCPGGFVPSRCRKPGSDAWAVVVIRTENISLGELFR